MKEEGRSALVDLLMADEPETARVDATRRWFNVLAILIRMAENHSCPLCDSLESNEDVRVRI